MAYGFKAENGSGWIQIDSSYKNMLASVSGNLSTTGMGYIVYSGTGDPPIGFTDSIPNVYSANAQIWIRPAYSWSGLNSTTSGAPFGIAVWRRAYDSVNDEMDIEFGCTHTGKTISYLVYSGSQNFSTSGTGYGLKVLDSSGNLVFTTSPTYYPPIPNTVKTANYSTYSWSDSSYSTPPWVMINACQPVETTEPDQYNQKGLAELVGVYWDPTSSSTGIVGTTRFQCEGDEGPTVAINSALKFPVMPA